MPWAKSPLVALRRTACTGGQVPNSDDSACVTPTPSCATSCNSGGAPATCVNGVCTGATAPGQPCNDFSAPLPACAANKQCNSGCYGSCILGTCANDDVGPSITGNSFSKLGAPTSSGALTMPSDLKWYVVVGFSDTECKQQNVYNPSAIALSPSFTPYCSGRVFREFYFSISSSSLSVFRALPLSSVFCNTANSESFDAQKDLYSFPPFGSVNLNGSCIFQSLSIPYSSTTTASFIIAPGSPTLNPETPDKLAEIVCPAGYVFDSNQCRLSCQPGSGWVLKKRVIEHAQAHTPQCPFPLLLPAPSASSSTTNKAKPVRNFRVSRGRRVQCALKTRSLRAAQLQPARHARRLAPCVVGTPLAPLGTATRKRITS